MTKYLMASTAIAALLMGTPARAIDPNITQAAPPVTAPPVTAAPAPNPPIEMPQPDTTPRAGGLLGGIFGCAANGSAQTIGTVAGGVVGGLLGNRIAGLGSRAIGTLLGGALGAVAGSVIGCKLQNNDRAKAERAAQDAVATGKSQDWKNEETGASGRVDVAGSGGGALGDIRFAAGVEPASGYTRVGDSFVATSAVNIRTAPAATAPVLGKLVIGQRVWVPASVKGKPWMLISDAGVGQGYVSSPLLKRATAVAASSCKMVTQTVSVPGDAEQAETYQACKGKDGNWVMTRV